MDVVYSIGYLLLLGGGAALSLYLYKGNFRAAGRFLGASSLALGISGLVSSYLGADGIAYRAIWIAFAFSLLGMLYLGLRHQRP